MYLKQLHILNFKNLRELSLTLLPKINCFIGSNGAGKTNILDAVYYLSLCKSGMGMTDNQCVTHTCDIFSIEGEYVIEEDISHRISCAYEKNGTKKVRREGKEYQKLSQHIGVVPLVMISPADSAIINEAAEERRRYLNTLISQIDPQYLENLIRYNKLIQERNKILKIDDPQSRGEMLDVFDMQLCDYGNRIYERRSEIIAQLAPRVAQYYAKLSGDREPVALSYGSKLNDRPLEALLTEAREKDMLNGYTSVGIHRDDIKMTISGYAINRYGSQGQQKSFIIALKLAQFDIIADRTGKRPILLLDDVFDKLDGERVEELISLVSGDGFGQIFISDCDSLRLHRILERVTGVYKLFTISDGEIDKS